MPAAHSAALIAAATADQAWVGTALPTAIVVALATVALVSIAIDLRRLRRTSKLRAVHTALGTAFTVAVVGGALAMTMVLGSDSTAAAEQHNSTSVDSSVVPAAAVIDKSDIVDASTDIQLPTLAD